MKATDLETLDFDRLTAHLQQELRDARGWNVIPTSRSSTRAPPTATSRRADSPLSVSG